MSYETFVRRRGGKGGPPALRLRNGRFVLNSRAVQELGAPAAVVILYDRALGQIKIRPATDAEQGAAWPLCYNDKRNNASLGVKGFLREIGCPVMTHSVFWPVVSCSSEGIEARNPEKGQS
jgi:hypothetical protein